MHNINNTPPPYIKRTPPQKNNNGCLRTILIVLGIGFIIAIVGGWYIYDQFSGNAAERFEDKENERLAKETLPDEYKSYQYLLDLESTDEYEIIPISLSDMRKYYYLPDKTLIITGASLSYANDFVYKISPKGQIIDSYYGGGLSFCGTSLIKEDIFYPPQLSNDDDSGGDIKAIVKPDPVIKTFYCNWPVNGDTTFYPMRPISEIASTKRDLRKAYERADVVKTLYLLGEVDGARTMMHIGDVWYISNYLKNEPEKNIIKEGYATLTSISNLDVKVKYKKYNRYYRERRGAFVIGGASSPGQRAHWTGDIYLHLKIGNTIIPFKKRFEDDRRDKDVNFTWIRMGLMNNGTYAIADDYLIRPK